MSAHRHGSERLDNLCHTLAGAALGQAGLKRRTPLGMATLVIGANLPDLDVLAVPLGHSLSFRRGWTHGVLALVLLPLALTLAMLFWDRWIRGRGGRRPERARAGALLLLSYVSVLSHPALDHLNTYGVRWLMPFSGRWFYGDALFIVDPWMWLALAAAVVAGRGGRTRRARVALGAAVAYLLLMLASAPVGRVIVRSGLARTGEPAPRAVMVGPVAVNPFRREVVVDQGDRYRVGTLSWLPRPRVELEREPIPRNTADPRAAMAASDPAAREFLVWSRYPFFVAEGDRVRIDDARYGRPGRPSWAAVTVHLPLAGER